MCATAWLWLLLLKKTKYCRNEESKMKYIQWGLILSDWVNNEGQHLCWGHGQLWHAWAVRPIVSASWSGNIPDSPAPRWASTVGSGFLGSNRVRMEGWRERSMDGIATEMTIFRSLSAKSSHQPTLASTRPSTNSDAIKSPRQKQ